MQNVIRSFALACVLSLGVAGCAGQLQQAGNFVQAVSSASVPEDVVLSARAAFNVAQAGATAVLRLKLCNGSNGPVCRQASWTPRIREAVLNGRAARNRLTALMRANPGGNVPIADYNTMVAATAIINDIRSAVGR